MRFSTNFRCGLYRILAERFGGPVLEFMSDDEDNEDIDDH